MTSVDGIELKDESPPERRKHPRFVTKQRFWIKVGADKQERWSKFYTINLSRNGCMVNMSGFPQQTRLKTKSKFDAVILVNLDDKVVKVHHLNAYVIHIQADGRVGFMFQRKPLNGSQAV